MLRIRQVIEENQDQEHVRPPERALSAERGAWREIVKRRRERARDELLRTNGFRLQDREKCIREEQRHHQAGDQAEDDVRVEVLDAVTLESLRMQYEAPIERKRDGGEDDEEEDVLRGHAMRPGVSGPSSPRARLA